MAGGTTWLARGGHCALLVSLLIFFLLGAPRSLFAQDDRAVLEIRGEVPIVCRAENFPSLMSLGDLLAENRREFRFEVHCNTPFSVTLESDNGGFKHKDLPLGTPGGHLPYDLALRIPLTEPKGAWLEIAERSTSLKDGGAAQSSGDGIAINQEARLDIEWSAPDARRLSAGEYQDTLVFTISPDT